MPVSRGGAHRRAGQHADAGGAVRGHPDRRTAAWTAAPGSAGGRRSTTDARASVSRVDPGPPLAVLDPADEHRGLDPAAHAQFGEDRGDAVLDGLLGQEEAFRDLAVGEALADEVEDLPLPGGESIQLRCLRLLGRGCSVPRSRAITRAVVRGSSIEVPEATLRTAVIRSAPLICLSTYPAAPAMMASNSASSSSNDVSIRQASSGIRARSSRHTSIPAWSPPRSSPRRTSSTATWGPQAGTRASASRASDASPTTSMSSSASSRSRTPRRTTSWSSRMKTRTGAVVGGGAVLNGVVRGGVFTESLTSCSIGSGRGPDSVCARARDRSRRGPTAW